MYIYIHMHTFQSTNLNQTGQPCPLEEYDRLIRACGVQNRPEEGVALLKVRLLSLYVWSIGSFRVIRCGI